MEVTEENYQEAKHFGEFYVDLIENFSNTFKYYLSNDVTLDWFGQTVKGEKNVTLFLKSNLNSVKHYFSNYIPAEKIGFRDTHVVKIPKESTSIAYSLRSTPQKLGLKTPTKTTRASTSTTTPKRGKVQPRPLFEGLNSSDENLEGSPAKRFKPSPEYCLELNTEHIESENDNIQIKNMTTEGWVEFHRPSIKKLQAETKWKRPCKLSIAYSARSKQDCTIYLIIYEGNVKCRRNLLDEFSKEESE